MHPRHLHGVIAKYYKRGCHTRNFFLSFRKHAKGNKRHFNSIRQASLRALDHIAVSGRILIVAVHGHVLVPGMHGVALERQRLDARVAQNLARDTCARVLQRVVACINQLELRAHAQGLGEACDAVVADVEVREAWERLRILL